MFLKARLATGAVAGILTFAVTGAAAFAGLVPVEPVATAAVYGTEAQTTAAERGDKNTGLVRALEAILERLVQNGTITADQKAKILEAVTAAGDNEDAARQLKQIWSNLMRLSVEYLGLPGGDVKEALGAGTSLGQLADATEGKSREGLISSVVAGVTTLIDTALAEGRITEEQAERARSVLVERVTKFVDHVYEKRPAKERAKERATELKERAKERAEELKERAKEFKERAKERAKDQRERAKERREEQKEEQGEEQDQDA